MVDSIVNYEPSKKRVQQAVTGVIYSINLDPPVSSKIEI